MESKSASVNFPVDTIRFIAIFLIIFLHSSGYPYKFLTSETTVIDIVNWFTLNFYDTIGMFGLPLFVMLTGALLLNPVKSDEPLRVFYKKRFNRIGLPFVFWTIIYFVWTFTVLDWSFTPFNVLQGLISGSYYHLWYLYVLMGLYAVTPVLRVLVKNLTRNLFTYLLILWFTGTVVTPAIHTFTDFNFNPVVFVIFDWVGYLLGIYLINSKIHRSGLHCNDFRSNRHNPVRLDNNCSFRGTTHRHMPQLYEPHNNTWICSFILHFSHRKNKHN